MLRYGVLTGLRTANTVLSRNVAPKPFAQLKLASTLSRYPRINRSSPTLVAIQRAQKKRNTASTVSGKPASQDIPHAIQNAREEAKGLTTDLAKIIASANFTKEAHVYDGFSDITSGLAARVPKPILLTGLAGAIPYIGTAATSLYFARQAGLLAAGHAARVEYDTAINLLEAALHTQVTYGAVLLSFLGALHWGMEFSGYGGQKGYSRLALGVAPVVFAWSTLSLDPTMALTAQWVGFTSLWYADMRVTAAGWTPPWYSQYRFYLSILIGTCIILTLWGENFFNPVSEDSLLSAGAPNLIKGVELEATDDEGKLKGRMPLNDIETVEGSSHYVIIRKIKEEGEEDAAATEDGEEAAADDDESKEKDSAGGDQSGDAKEHQEEVAEKQEGKEKKQSEGKAGQVKSGESGRKDIAK